MGTYKLGQETQASSNKGKICAEKRRDVSIVKKRGESEGMQVH